MDHPNRQKFGLTPHDGLQMRKRHAMRMRTLLNIRSIVAALAASTRARLALVMGASDQRAGATAPGAVSLFGNNFGEATRGVHSGWRLTGKHAPSLGSRRIFPIS